MIKYDEIELLPENTEKFKKVDELVKKEMDKNKIRGIGSCHIFWGMKKKLLMDLYNIDWKTPVELNPGVLFD